MEATIQLPVSERAAKTYEAVSDTEREQITEIVEEALRKVAAQRLLALMDKMAKEAAANGLTPEILAEILNDDSDDE